MKEKTKEMLRKINDIELFDIVFHLKNSKMVQLEPV